MQIHILIVAFDSSYLKSVFLYAGGKGLNVT